MAAYRFAPRPKSSGVLAQLLGLNHKVAKAITQGEPVTPPGVPGSFGDPAELITDDCIRAE